MKMHSLLLAICCSVGAIAGTVPREQISADAKWVVHLDVDALLGTQLGKFVGRELVDPKASKLSAGLKQQFDLDLDWRQIHSLTAYGTDFKEPAKANGVVLVRSGLDVGGALATVFEKLQANGGGAEVPLRKVQDQPFPIYSFQDSVFGAALGPDLFALAHSRAQLEKAQRILSGQAANLASTTSLPDRAGQPSGFLTVAIADTAAAGAGLPPQARLLKDALGAQLVAGEKSDKLFVNAALDAKDAAVAVQLQQALQGIVAFAQLSELENKELKQLAQAVKVSGNEKTVTLDVQVPVTDVIDKMGKPQKKRRAQAQKPAADQ
jgi:hypothetical protein